jgi:hypothetical protein
VVNTGGNGMEMATCVVWSGGGLFDSMPGMAGLGLFDPKSALTVTMPIATAFKFCIGHKKMGS